MRRRDGPRGLLPCRKAIYFRPPLGRRGRGPLLVRGRVPPDGGHPEGGCSCGRAEQGACSDGGEAGRGEEEEGGSREDAQGNVAGGWEPRRRRRPAAGVAGEEAGEPEGGGGGDADEEEPYGGPHACKLAAFLSWRLFW